MVSFEKKNRENICKKLGDRGLSVGENMDVDKLISLVYAARKIVFSENLNAEEKNANPYDFVTAVDTGISEFLKNELKKAFPTVGFITEEEQEHIFSDKVFILDPIDGTTNLVYDYKMSSISLAYVEGGAVQVGIVYNPFSDELFFAIKGKGAYLYDARNGIRDLMRIGANNYTVNRLSTCKRMLKKSLIEFGAGSSYKSEAEDNFARGRRVFEKCLDIRRTCSTAMALCYIAAGRLDGYFEKVIKPWDYAAGILILSEAGGCSSDWNGAPLPLNKPSTIVCSNGTNYEELMTLL